MEWCLGATLADGTGEIPVIIGNEVLEELIGFSLREFRDTIEPDPQYRARGKEVSTLGIDVVSTVYFRV